MGQRSETAAQLPSQSSQRDLTENSSNNRTGRNLKFCHYFVNQGRCNYVERTGFRCKFEHKVAPMCNSGMNCTRQKCMFSHPKVNTSAPFLGRNAMINPWQLMNPWMQMPPSQLYTNSTNWNLQERPNQ